jgi:3',5'-cyclic AMP phosphodiesterase CpdA
VGGLKPATRYEYSVRVGKGQTRKATLRTLPEPDKPLTVAIVGDPQSGRAWKSVAAALTEKRPDLVVIAGDLVVDGLVEQQWHETFLDPAEDLLAAVPFLVVPGNHDRYSPLMETLFGYGKPRPHWTRRAGGALLVGIDGGADFSPDGPGRRWLAGKLCRADAPLAFVVSHYPAYSSRNHGKLADDGRVLEWTSRSARNHLVPLLNKHGVAALFGGHDHGYERSELPGGLTALVTGGGGAGTYPKRTDAQKQNPYSKAFAAKHHYSLLRIDDGNATLRVLTPEGRQIDTRRWTAKPRKEKQL